MTSAGVCIFLSGMDTVQVLAPLTVDRIPVSIGAGDTVHDLYLIRYLNNLAVLMSLSEMSRERHGEIPIIGPFPSSPHFSLSSLSERPKLTSTASAISGSILRSAYLRTALPELLL